MLFARDELKLNATMTGWRLAISIAALALVLIALLAREALAQERTVEPFHLTGTVVDDVNGAPLVGAWVSFSGSEWGSVTDDEGRFRIPEVYPGPAMLETEQLGYLKLEWEGELNADADLELRMEPKPILLAGLAVVTNRFERRRNATATTVRAFDRADLVSTAQRTALDFVALRAGAARLPCGAASVSNNCLWVRGRTVSPVVYVDEHRVVGGLDFLDALEPHELHMIEVYGSGRHIRVYTDRFMERAARTRLLPIALLF